jgi:hypothetical protein
MLPKLHAQAAEGRPVAVGVAQHDWHNLLPVRCSFNTGNCQIVVVGAKE